MTLAVYVAGAWVEQYERARPMIAKLLESGLAHITMDWTQAEGDVCECGHHRQIHGPYTGWAYKGCGATRENGDGCACLKFNEIAGGDSKLTNEARRKYALDDLNGVLDADVLWLLAANTPQAAGSWCELGIALGASMARDVQHAPVNPTIVVSGPNARRTIFSELADHIVPTDEEGLALVLAMAKACA